MVRALDANSGYLLSEAELQMRPVSLVVWTPGGRLLDKGRLECWAKAKLAPDVHVVEVVMSGSDLCLVLGSLADAYKVCDAVRAGLEWGVRGGACGAVGRPADGVMRVRRRGNGGDGDASR